MTIHNGGEYEWFGGGGGGRQWLPPTSLSSEFKIIDQIFGQTHRKNEHKSKLWKQCITGSVWHVVVAANPDGFSLRVSLSPRPPSLFRSPIFGNACGPAGMPEHRNAGRNGDECQCIKFIQWLLQLFFFHDEALWAKGGLAWQEMVGWGRAEGGAGKGRQINCKTCNKTGTSQMCV